MDSHEHPLEPTRRTRRIAHLAVAGALALAAAACTDADNGADSDAEPGSSAPGSDADSGAVSSAAEEPGEGAVDASGGPEAEIAPLVGVPLNPGVTTVDFLGTPMTFEVGERWRIAVAGDGAFVITSPENTDPSGPTMIVARPSGFAAEDELAVEPPPRQFSATREEWLEHSGITVTSGPTDTSVGGVGAIVTESELVDPERSFQCGPSPADQCVFWMSTLDEGGLGHLVARTGQTSRTWVVEQGQEPPIVISIGAPEEQAEWLDVFDDIVESIEFGEVQPAPGVPVDDAP